MDDVMATLRAGSGSCRRASWSLLLHLWDVYSAPSPAGGGGVLTLVGLCSTVAVVTGALLHHWLSSTLKYPQAASALAASTYGVAVLAVSLLLHPLRCVLTLTLPTVCTQQGRKLLVSASVMVLLLNVVPNVAANVGAAARLLGCTAEGLARSLLNSTAPLNAAKRDLVEEAVRVRREDLSVVTNLRKLDHFTRVDVSEVRRRFGHMIRLMEADFSHAGTLLHDYRLLSNRILAAVFVVLLVFESARYLRSFLTSVKFDNPRVPGRSGDEKPSTNQISRSICRISSEEFTSCFFSVVVVTLYFTGMSVIVALDHVVYHILQTILPWLLDFPPTSAVITVDYQVKWFPPAFCLIPQSCVTRELTHFHRDYRWTFDPEPSRCDAAAGAAASPPNAGVRLLLVCLWAVSYCLVFLEVYARRLRRKISASFFREQEEKRRRYRLEKEARGGERGRGGVQV